MSYEERKYRKILNKERFEYFSVLYLETDLWIGVGKGFDHLDLKRFVLEEILVLRTEIEAFIAINPEFQSAFLPVTYPGKIPAPIAQLIHASSIANTGPMAGIAGLFSEYIGQKIRSYTSESEIVVENGGDIYSYAKKELGIGIYAGESPLSNSMALNIPAGEWGICTSSGTVGHSKSFGKADAVTVVAKSTVLADALATQIANQVQSPDDIERVLEASAQYENIEGVVIICEDKMGIIGNLELIPIV